MKKNGVCQNETQRAFSFDQRSLTTLLIGHSLLQSVLSSIDLRALEGPDKKSLQDHAALAISSLGENITLRRALFVSSPGDILIAGYTHPSPDGYSDKVMAGKYAALVAYTADSNDDKANRTAKQVCQHIVGKL